MLIGLKLNPVHLSLSTSALGPPLGRLLRFGTAVNKNRDGPRSISSLLSRAILRVPLRPRAGFPPRSPPFHVIAVARGRESDSRNGRSGFLAERGHSHQLVDARRYKLYVPRYTPRRRMEELFSGARPLSPFYGDVKLISDSRGRGGENGGRGEEGERTEEEETRRATSIIRSADAMSSRLKSIGCFFSREERRNCSGRIRRGNYCPRRRKEKRSPSPRIPRHR